MRPAEVCGWYRYPFSSRSLIVLRIVAADSIMPDRREIVRLPAGSAVSTYVEMTASSTCRSRSVRDCDISPNLLAANNLGHYSRLGQVAHQGIEPKPALGSAHQALAPQLCPATFQPAGGRGP